MDGDANSIKIKTLEAIERTVSVFKRSSNYQYRIRCPFCGDSQKNLTEAHLYLKCSPEPTEPILYNCFKCNSSGRVNGRFLKLLGVDQSGLEQLDNQRFNRVMSVKHSDVEVMTGSPDLNSDQVGYTEYRLGEGLTERDYELFKIVWDMQLVHPFVGSQKVKNTLPSNNDSISFISDDKSMLLTRFFNPGNGLRWKKTKLFQNDNRSFYTVKGTLDLFTRDPITVNIAEGIFDIVSVYKNFNSGESSVYLAFLGKDYEMAIDYTVAKGIIGSNVNLRIYVDSDVDRRQLKQQLKRYRWLFGSITLIWNSTDVDFGVKPERIKPVEIKL